MIILKRQNGWWLGIGSLRKKMEYNLECILRFNYQLTSQPAFKYQNGRNNFFFDGSPSQLDLKERENCHLI
jgi:hypothetical protein